MTTYEITFNEKTKTGKNFLAFLEENKKYLKVNNPAKMTKEEFEAMIDESLAQYERGEYKELKYEDIDKFIDNL